MLNLAFLLTATQCECTNHDHCIVWKWTLRSRTVGTVMLMIKYCNHCLSLSHTSPCFQHDDPILGNLLLCSSVIASCSRRIIKAWLAHWRFIVHISPFSVKLQVRLAVQPGSSRARRRNYSSSINQSKCSSFRQEGLLFCDVAPKLNRTLSHPLKARACS